MYIFKYLNILNIHIKLFYDFICFFLVTLIFLISQKLLNSFKSQFPDLLSRITLSILFEILWPIHSFYMASNFLKFSFRIRKYRTNTICPTFSTKACILHDHVCVGTEVSWP